MSKMCELKVEEGTFFSSKPLGPQIFHYFYGLHAGVCGCEIEVFDLQV